jgi:hypothetical protein
MALPTPEYPAATWAGNEQDTGNDPGAEDPTIAEGRDYNLMATELVAAIADLRAAFAVESAADLAAAIASLRASINAQASHAAQHKFGGGDQVATPAPGANLIPMSAGTGKLTSGWIPLATEAAVGGLEVATQPETNTGVNDDRIVTPLKLANWTGLPFGQGYQSAVSAARSTTTSTSFQTKAQLVTPTLTGTFRVAWMAVVDNSALINAVEAQLYNVTDAAIVAGLAIHEPQDVNNRIHVGGFAEVVFSGAAKTFEIQYRATGATAGIAEARIEIWRVS